MPHETAAFALCDELGPAAEFEGVVNTIRIESDGRVVGESFMAVDSWMQPVRRLFS